MLEVFALPLQRLETLEIMTSFSRCVNANSHWIEGLAEKLLSVKWQRRTMDGDAQKPGA